MAILTGSVSGPIIRSQSLDRILQKASKSARQMLNTITCSTQFSAKEKLILSALIKNRGQIFSREHIGQILWGQEAADRWSDWALDQTISRIRRKLTAIPAFTSTPLVTLKKVGVKLIL